MERKDIELEEVYNNYEKGFNGWMPQEDIPEAQKKVTYPHPNKPGEKTSQNYAEYNDLAIVVLVRKNENGELQFGLREKEAPAFIEDLEENEETKGYYGIFLEALTFALPEKNEVPENMIQWIDQKILDLGYEPEGIAGLDESKTAIVQSFTDQDARFYAAWVKNERDFEDPQMHWFDISSLKSYLEMQRWGGKDGIHSSAITLYPLELLRNKYINQIKNEKPTEFVLDRPLPRLKIINKNKVNPGYRFSIMEVEYINEDEPNETKFASYLKSRANAGNCIISSKDKKYTYWSLQQRSPFLATGDELKQEVTGGLIENKANGKEDFKDTALRELREEQGYDTDYAEPLTGIFAVSPLNDELCITFRAYYDKNNDVEQKLDEKEKIGEKIPYDLETLTALMKTDKIPLGYKYIITLMLREREQELEMKKRNDEER